MQFKMVFATQNCVYTFIKSRTIQNYMKKL